MNEIANVSKKHGIALQKQTKMMLQELPVDHMLDLAMEYCASRGVYEPYEGVDTEFLFDIAIVWDHFLREKVRNGWRYRLGVIQDFSSDAVYMRLVTQRKHSITQLILIEDMFDEYYVYSEYEDAHGFYHAHEQDFDCLLLMRFLKMFLDCAQGAIRQWNNTCRRHPPIFTRPIPFADVSEQIIKGLRSYLIHEYLPYYNFDLDTYPELAPGNDYSREDVLRLYLERDGDLELDKFYYVLEESFYEVFGGWKVLVEGIHGDGYSRYQVIIRRSGMDFQFMLSETESDQYYYTGSVINISNIDDVLSDIFEDLEYAMLQWNDIVLPSEVEVHKEPECKGFESAIDAPADLFDVLPPKELTLYDKIKKVLEPADQLELPFSG